VKPAQGAGWFGWHTDAAHQHEAMAALLPREPSEHTTVAALQSGERRAEVLSGHQTAAALQSDEPRGPSTLPEYVSFWCPLDDITEDNGCLLLLPFDAPQPPGASPDLPASEPALDWLQGEAAAPHVLSMNVRAGTAVLFSSQLWHCSKPNVSGRDRRVFYAQYSVGAVGGEASPLSLAVRTQVLPSSTSSTNDG
jgi:ectoine hydroxylase-related dioxygenase (phytanoyl-CoA dioxygenase family)